MLCSGAKFFFFYLADWRYRHAALMAISAVAEGCVKQMEPLLPSVVDSILPFLMDQHPRVRHAACNALGQLSSDFNILFQKKFHDKVMPGLCKVLLVYLALGRASSPRLLFENVAVSKQVCVRLGELSCLNETRLNGLSGLC